MRSIVRLARSAAIVGSFIFFGFGSAWLSFVYLPWVRWRTPPEQRAERSQLAVHRGFRFFLRVVAFVQRYDLEIDAQGADAIDGPYVLMANHPTLIDVILLTAAHRRLVSVVKGEYYRVPVLRPLLRQCAYIDGADRSPSALEALIEQSVERLREGVSVLAFPEGTRSRPGELRPFRRAPFEIAAVAGVPIRPAAIFVDPPTLTGHEPWYRPSEPVSRFRIKYLPLIEVGPGRRGAKAAMLEVERVIREQLELFRLQASHGIRDRSRK